MSNLNTSNPVANISVTDPTNTSYQMKVNADGSINTGQNTGASIALSSPPSTTNAGSDTQLTFTTKANHFLIQNNTNANVYVGLDAAASPSSIVLVPGAMWRDNISVTSPHLYTVAAQNINGTTGIVVLGWS